VTLETWKIGQILLESIRPESKTQRMFLLLLGIDLRNLDGSFNRLDKYRILSGGGNVR
jgi:hypothetical protein